ncbi:metallophosphoesterase family protein [Roseobacter sp. CCS2]|uniref:metallophosphoesterase family protein n=1 Tax=Roseobacter sp. CCS2 TaxID=391593 RepID=UPI0000F40215|nr:metallophosphoesterase family protein [Roseobacter sp. CCS2]EBA13615.1 serine/threonine protein phosphatase family protein [Roseobacter sp. CCS2]
MKPVYAIGDIHGQKEMLDQALALIVADGGPDAQIVFLGDYTDRGPDSRAVINTLIAGRDAGRDWVFIKGNHDRLFTNFVKHGIEHDTHVKSGISWLNPRLGGSMTLASYGLEGVMHFAHRSGTEPEVLDYFEGPTGQIDKDALQAMARSAVPEVHVDFLKNLPLWYQTDDLFFVHAGLRPGLPLAFQDPEDLIWIREPFLGSRADFGRLVVHGHTALDHPQHFGNRVDLDGGAGYGNPLIPAVFEGRDCWLLTDQGRVPLTP